MPSALVIGSTGFTGRHVVADLLEHGYAVTGLARGRSPYEFPDRVDVDQVEGDRTDRKTLADVSDRADPDVVVDCAAFSPADVRDATEVFADVDAYVYVSSGSVYAVQDIPKREDETTLRECSAEQAADETMTTYPARKAGADREARAAAGDGIRAMVVRPSLIYGPETLRAGDASPTVEPPAWATGGAPQTRHDYWIDRLDRSDRVVVPGDGTAIWHRAYVEDVAAACRIVAERGERGEAYNVGDRRVCTLEDILSLILDELGSDVEFVHANRRELATVGLEPEDFPFYHHPMTGYPHVLSTCKLARLGWDSTPVTTAMERTVAESLASGRDGSTHGPGRAAEAELLDLLAG